MKLGRIFLCACIAFVLSSCSKGGKVIPASKMADIYADMFLADQWISSRYSERRKADTTLFYAPIFEKYGYTTEDYDASVKYYVSKPDDYSKILKTAALKLDRKAKYLQKVEDYYNNRKPEFSPYVPKNFSFDSLMVCDTMMRWHISDTLSNIDTLINPEIITDLSFASGTAVK